MQKPWQSRWYYIMQNKTSGMKYVGQTVMLQMDQYCGSGRYWIAHCTKHGGHNRSNVEVLFSKWFDNEGLAQSWLDSLPFEYWKSEEFANRAFETTKDSPLAGIPIETRQRNAHANRWKLKGKPKTIEHAKNISKGKKGIPQTPEHIAALSAVRKGRKLSSAHIISRTIGIRRSKVLKLTESLWKEVL